MTMGWYTGALANELQALSSDLRASSMNGILMAAGVLCRTAVGIGSDYLPIARITLLAIIMIPASAAFALLAIFGTRVFLPTLVMIGMSFGACWCLVPLQIADTFGAGFGSLWGVALLATAVGPLLMQPIDSFVWSSHANTSGVCSGLHCYQSTYICASCINGLCAVLCAIVGCRSARARASSVVLLCESEISCHSQTA